MLSFFQAHENGLRNTDINLRKQKPIKSTFILFVCSPEEVEATLDHLSAASQSHGFFVFYFVCFMHKDTFFTSPQGQEVE